jgi:hypothetical protein
MKLPFRKLNAAIIARLAADQPSFTVTSYVRQKSLPAFPYIRLESFRTIGDPRTADSNSTEVVRTLNFFTKSSGDKALNDMIDDTVQALTRAPLDLGSSFDPTWFRIVRIETFTEEVEGEEVQRGVLDIAFRVFEFA